MICTGNSVVRVDDRLEPAPGETGTSVSGLVAAGVWVIGLVIGLIALGIGQVGIASHNARRCDCGPLARAGCGVAQPPHSGARTRLGVARGRSGYCMCHG